MRVAFLTHYFPPEVGAPQARLDGLTAGLAARGMDVAVHTGFPHYPDGRVLPPYRAGVVRREDRDGVRVVRSAVLPVANRGTVLRLADHATFALGAVLSGRMVGRRDVVVAESPPLFLAVAAARYARARGAALVLNVADRWPESVVAVGAMDRGRLVTAAERLEAFAYSRATVITAPAVGLARALDEHPAARGRVRRIPPVVAASSGRVGPVAPRPGPLRVLYAGTVGMAQRLDTLIDAARIVGPDVVRVAIAGSGADAPRLRERTVREGIDHVRWLGTVPRDDVGGLLEDAEVVAVLLRDAPLFRDALPTKLVEAMVAGRPVALSAAGEPAVHVERAGCGVVAPPEDPVALADALRGLWRDRAGLVARGERGRDYARMSFSPDASIDAWAALLTDVAARRA
ncbi:MAG: glycosyltransferase family 4 protein [Solirubrobacteraceae bacterium]|nr:glycosyltransferase family 4 protein [Solirubrobacteraceae bacterium]